MVASQISRLLIFVNLEIEQVSGAHLVGAGVT
jgi:hypothetical protein